MPAVRRLGAGRAWFLPSDLLVERWAALIAYRRAPTFLSNLLDAADESRTDLLHKALRREDVGYSAAIDGVTIPSWGNERCPDAIHPLLDKNRGS